jgi:hypothetical protein
LCAALLACAACAKLVRVSPCRTRKGEGAIDLQLEDHQRGREGSRFDVDSLGSATDLARRIEAMLGGV